MNDDPIKPQTVRLIDVMVIGPVMVAGAMLLSGKHEVIRWTLGAAGVATILYNARNYVEIDQQRRA